MTYREYLTRLAWLENQWDVKTKQDYYFAQIAAEVQRVLSKNPNTISIESKIMKFGSSDKPLETKDEATKASKSRWSSFLGFGRKKDNTNNPPTDSKSMWS